MPDIDLLISRIKQGEKEAFEVLYDKYSAALFGVVTKIVRSEEIGQDVMQEAFVKIWKKIHSYDSSKGSLFTWMLNISRNTAIDKWRKIKREQKVEIQTDESVVGIQNQHTSINIDSIGLKELVDKLTPEQKLVVEYIYFNGYTQQEVSDELGIPLGTVKSRVRKAVIELRKVFIKLLLWI
ncbi:MAG: RNA polymerase sigma factor [Chitinophagales bacterium]|nr:RNA polymerase sigma factor [Chitinophagales bacterium]